MYKSPISWSLRNVQVGDTVMYKSGYNDSEPSLSKVVHVTLYKDGTYVGKARVVKLEDKTTWTGDGEKWGNASAGYKSAYRTRAYQILDFAAYEAEKEAAAAARLNNKRREAVEQNAKLFTKYATDKEIMELRGLQYEMMKRQLCNTLVSYLRSLAGYNINEEITP